MKEPKPTVAICVRVHPDVRDMLGKLSKELGVSMTAVMEGLIDGAYASLVVEKVESTLKNVEDSLEAE
jgi:hypothetical protein